MPIITRINTRNSPLAVAAQGYQAERREWVKAEHATIFAEEYQAIAVIQDHELVDVGIFTDELFEELFSEELPGEEEA